MMVYNAVWKQSPDGTHYCSHCGTKAGYTREDIASWRDNIVGFLRDKPSKFCPGCGAEMFFEKHFE